MTEIAIGDKVRKVSGRKFKSGQYENTVDGFTINPNTGKPAFTFKEDSSIVDAYICLKVELNNE